MSIDTVQTADLKFTTLCKSSICGNLGKRFMIKAKLLFICLFRVFSTSNNIWLYSVATTESTKTFINMPSSAILQFSEPAF